MKISQAIKFLQKAMKEHGDLELYEVTVWGGLVSIEKIWVRPDQNNEKNVVAITS